MATVKQRDISKKYREDENTFRRHKNILYSLTSQAICPQCLKYHETGCVVYLARTKLNKIKTSH